ncbi:hypothetical protein ABW20_dc0106945 [Dactylellina cionopaga]|nr:hypothetical protein ABW20_dc0106945 [Dactylellina cionopaga]
MVEGLAESVSTISEWERLDELFKTTAQRTGYEQWMKEEKFIQMLDDNATPARIFLQKVLNESVALKSKNADLDKELNILKIDGKSLRDQFMKLSWELKTRTAELDRKEKELGTVYNNIQHLKRQVEHKETELIKTKSELAKRLKSR